MTIERRQTTDFPDLLQVGIPEFLRRLASFEPDRGWLRVEQFTDDGTLVVRAELPDIDPEKDVELSVADGVLHIEAHREDKTEHKDAEVYRSEFRYGSFVRNIPLPERTRDEDIAATYKDGILEVRAPLAEEPAEAVRKVPISHG